MGARHPAPRRCPGPTRRARRVLLALLAACALVPTATVLAPVSPALADDASTTDTRPAVLGTEAGSDSSGLDVAIEDLSPRVLTTQDHVVVSGTITNTTEGTLEGGIHIEVHLQSVTPLSQEQLTGFLSGTQPSGALVATTTLDRPLAAGQSAAFAVTVATSDLPLGSSFGWGPRGLSVHASVGDASGRDRTVLVWDSGYEVASTGIGTLVPWTSASGTDPSAEGATALDLAATPGVTLAIDPEVLTGTEDPDSVDGAQSGVPPSAPSSSPSATPTPTGTTTPGATGSPTTTASPTPSGTTSDAGSPTSDAGSPTSGQSGDGTTTSFTRTLLDTADEVVALPSWDADLAALAMGGSQSLLDLASKSRDSSLDQGTATVVRDVVWPTTRTFGRQALQAFPGETFIAPPGSLEPTDEISFTSVARVEVDPTTGKSSTQGATDATVSVLTSQTALAELLSWEPTSAADELDTEQVLTALSAVITRELPNQSRTLFVPVSRGTTFDSSLTSRLTALLDQRWVAPLSFTDVVDSDPTDLQRQTVAEAPALDDLTSRVFTSISDALSSTASLAEAIPQPRDLQDRLEDAALETLSATGTTEERSERLSDFEQLVHSLLTAVRAEPSATVNLINKSANFPVRVTNDLPWDVTVVVTLEPSDPRLSVTSPQTTTIPARSTASVDVPVSAIGSGDITVGYLVTTPGGQVLDDAQSVTVRMRAGWEDMGTAVVAGALVVMLVAGVARTVRRRLRDRPASEEER